MDLITFKNNQIQDLQDKLCEANSKITQLETYIFELCDKKCPEAYKEVIQSEVFKHLKKHNIYNG
jgi:uncharacterized protein YutD